MLCLTLCVFLRRMIQTEKAREDPDPVYKTRHSELLLRMRAGSVHLQRLEFLNGKAVFKQILPPEPASFSMKLIFVRHAETEWNRHGVIQGHKDSPLMAVACRRHRYY